MHDRKSFSCYIHNEYTRNVVKDQMSNNLRILLSYVQPYPNPAKVLGCIHSVTLGANPFRRTTAGTGGSWLGQELQVHSFHV